MNFELSLDFIKKYFCLLFIENGGDFFEIYFSSKL